MTNSERRQSDAEFVKSCGFRPGSDEANMAIALRREFAKYGRTDPETITTDASIESTGIIHPTDSIDLAEYTLHLEHVIGIRFEPQQVVNQVVQPGVDLFVREWVQRVVVLAADCAAVGREGHVNT